MTPITYSYPLYENTEAVGALSVMRLPGEFNKTKPKWVIRDSPNHAIELAQLKINGAPAQHLKGLNGSSPPQEGRCTKKDGLYSLQFEGGWISKQKKEIKQVRIQIRHGDERTFEISVPGCCKISGLRQCIEEQYEKNEWLLYYSYQPLQESLSIDEYGMKEGDVVRIVTQAGLREGESSRQMGTGSSYTSIGDFEEYVLKMKEKINLVCQICCPTGDKTADYGTGFLIGNYLIMTNHHVIEDHRKIKATFFYHDVGQGIEIDVHEERVCFSPSPGNHKKATQNNLDYAILQLQPPRSLTSKQIAQMHQLNQIAKSFFEGAFTSYKRRKNEESKLLHTPYFKEVDRKEKQVERANIIQHPVENKDPRPKQIAFRENTVQVEGFLLHYKNETSKGTSGSPVINDKGELIGVHYASCVQGEKRLFENRQALFRKLGYMPQPSLRPQTEDHYIKDNERVFVHLTDTEKRKGECFKPSQVKWVSLRTLISESLGMTPKQSRFIHEFVQAEKIPFEEEQHLYCNTAVNITNIFKDLQIHEEKLKNARTKAEEEWEAFAKQQRSPFEKYKRGIFIGITLVVVGIGVTWIWKKK